MKSKQQKKPRVVIVGGGFGGLYAARQLKRANVDVVLVDRRNFHLFQPLLYQVATGGLSPANIAAPLRSILRRQRNARVILGEVTDFDLLNSRIVLAKNGDQPGFAGDANSESSEDVEPCSLDFDYLIVAAGSENSFFGNDHWEPIAPGLKTIEDATKIRGKILTAFEQAEIEQNPDRRRALMTFVVVGGGPTGVELAGAISEIARNTLASEFRRIHSQDARILLVDAGSRILSAYPEKLSSKAQKSLQEIGVQVQLNSKVAEIAADHVLLQSGTGTIRVDTSVVLWAAGVKAHSLSSRLAERAGADTRPDGRIVVNSDLSIGEFTRVFAVGDMAWMQDRSGKEVPGVAPAAIQQGKYVAKLIRRESAGRAAKRGSFRYRDLGSLATIGRSRAVADFGRFKFGGRLAWLLWLFIHLMQIVQHENRLLIFVQWAWNYLTFNRSARLITESSETDQW